MRLNVDQDIVTDGDPRLRALGSEAIGRLTSLGGTNLLTKQVKILVDTVVSNRDPSARAGCALAFGSIHTHVGGLAVGPLLKTTVNILMSLSTDPHPVVHYWALRALSQVIDAASLSYSSFISGTLGMLYNGYSLSSHEDGGGNLTNANLRSTLPTHEAICHVIDNVIAIMGPELQESTHTRSLILDMVHEFRLEDGNGIKVEAIKCIQHFLLFASNCVDLGELVDQLRALLATQCQPLKEVSINALYQLVQKDALLMSKTGGDQLVETLFRMLDEDAAIEGVRNIIVSWLKQTASLNPSAWIDLCQRILSRTVQASITKASMQRPVGLRDEEGESLGIDLPPEQTGSTLGLTSRWRTQLFSLRCLHLVFETVTKAGRPEHFDIGYARSQRIPTAHLLVSRVADLIKMAFTASAAHVTDIRLQGLVVLRDIIEVKHCKFITPR
jgi:HEAT repeat-containing protein 5